MAKLPIIARHIDAKSKDLPKDLLDRPGSGKLQISLKQQYWLVDEAGRQMSVRVVGNYDKDIFVRDISISGKSSSLSRLKRYGAIEKIIIGSGVFDLFR